MEPVAEELAQNEAKRFRAVIMAHYLANNFFLPDGGAIHAPDALKDIPVRVIGNTGDPLVGGDTLPVIAEKIPHAEIVNVPRIRHARVTPEDFDSVSIEEMGAIKSILTLKA